MTEFIPFIMQMMADPPDPNVVPLGNRHATIYGVTIPFHILCWVAVGLRLHTRLRVVRQPGLDDLIIVFALVFKLIGLVAFYGGLREGMGKHIIYIFNNLEMTMIWFYVANGTYIMTTVCVKLSLLFQYLRLFREGYRRVVTWILLIMVVLWGTVFTFMAWFPCFPVSGFWDKRMVPQAKCYGFGYRTVDEAKNTLFAFSGSNIVLDTAIFVLPLTEYFKPDLKRKQILAMTGLFTFGSIVVLMAILRLWSGVKYNNTVTLYDFTWWMPEVWLFSCLEVDFAIISASMPIFWPSVMAKWTEIFVTQEVMVVHARRSHYVQASELDVQMQRLSRRKSNDSYIALTEKVNAPSKSFLSFLDPDTGRSPSPGVAQVEVHTSERLTPFG
ncbi:hypothetical protein BDU57DRAFT_441371 [Ampelomyces quisqualis]|uniref:Rhodopsin domain-containing protein n=1 Tax=Ampelomyces quisqualis TaxID=50730 RepID=A0A6A5QWA3_AMPQU|nr:hypothetical protein BDU57DRAFT_441371 [Ampelomyces quisqualis]